MTINAVNSTTITLFSIMMLSTLVVTYWAALRTKKKKDFYAAGGNITPMQNALALVGDFVSASSFLGFTGLIALNGFDGLIYPMMGLMGWPLVLFLVAEPLRKLGKYTFADALAFRMSKVPIRISASITSLSCTIFYLIAQMIGAGYLIQLIFGIPYFWAEIIVGSAMIIYVLFGGMIATTWVQIIKAVLLMAGAIVMTFLVLDKFNFSPAELVQSAVEKYSTSVVMPGSLYSNSVDLMSLGLAFMFGTAGLPHILMRFYTVPNPIAARKSAFYATGMIGLIYILCFFLGFGAMALVGRESILALDKGGNMAALLLADVLGGSVLLGYIAAVAFATILAVVAGLTLSGAATISHDIWAGVIKKDMDIKGDEVRVARISTLVLGLLSVVLGITFEGQNVAILVGLAFSIAASSNFPALILSTFWKKATTQGVVAAIITGGLGSILLIGCSSTVMVDILGYSAPLFGFKNPGFITIPLAFIVGIIVSLLTKDSHALQMYQVAQDKMNEINRVGKS